MKSKDKERSIESIKEGLITKTVNNKEYYYLRITYDVRMFQGVNKKTKDIYVCPKSCNQDELRDSFNIAKAKGIIELFVFIYDIQEKLLSHKYLTKGQIKNLIILQFGYNVLLKKFNENDLKRYEDAIFTKYVYGTTSIEGNTYTLRETDITLNEGLTVSGKERREFFEIENYSKLKAFIDKLTRIKITVSFVKKIHKLIMTNIDDENAGEFRRIDVGIRGTEFTPCPGILVEDKMNELIAWYQSNDGRIHPVELASIFHQKFEEVHPFIDGNGRVGREILRIMLKKYGYPSIFIDRATREKYLKSLDAGNSGNHKEICDFIVENIVNVHSDLLDKAKEEFKESLKEIRKSGRDQEINKKLERTMMKFVNK